MKISYTWQSGDYEKYTSTSYMSKFSCLGDAIRFSLNRFNVGKTQIVMLEINPDNDTCVYGVCSNKIAKMFISGGYEIYHPSLADMSIL